MSYTRLALKGFTWQTGLKFLLLGSAFLKIKSLALVLSPGDFGIASLVFVVLGATEAFLETGINTTLLQSQKKLDFYLDTAWVISIMRGVMIAIIMLAVGLGSDRLFSDSRLMWWFALGSLVPLVRGFINPSIVSLQKNLLFSQEFGLRSFLVIFETLAVVMLGFWWQSVAAIIVALLGTALVELILSFSLFKLKPSFVFVIERAREILHNARGLTPYSMMNYLTQNIDNFLIGNLLGTTQLGYYSNAYSLSHKPNMELARALQQSLLPIFVRLNLERKNLSKLFYRSLSLVLVLSVATSLPFLIWPEVMTKLLLSEEWLVLAPLLLPLTLAGILQGVVTLLQTLLTATKEYRAINYSLLFNLIALVFGFVVWSQFGLLFLSWWVFCSRLISLPLLVWGLRKL